MYRDVLEKHKSIGSIDNFLKLAAVVQWSRASLLQLSIRPALFANRNKHFIKSNLLLAVLLHLRTFPSRQHPANAA